jgi:CheY-like chemotaxis protein
LVLAADHELRVKLRRLLESLGITVFSAANPIEGLAVLQKIDPPLFILLSENTPLMSPAEFLNFKMRLTDVSPVPVIFISDNESPPPEGVAQRILRPVGKEILAEIVKRYSTV